MKFQLLLIFSYLTLSWGQKATYYSFTKLISGEHKRVAITFDDGPHGTLTPKLLDVLKEKGAKATFFVMGIKAELHPDILKRAVSEGHEVANHVWDHPVLSKLPFEKVHDQLLRTNNAIESAIGKLPSAMRPPYGNTNKKLNAHINKAENLDVIMWSLDTNDWKRPGSKEIVKRVMDKVQSGTIVLCHDIHPGTIEAMPLLIDALVKAGYVLSTVSELIELQNKDISSTKLLRGRQ